MATKHMSPVLTKPSRQATIKAGATAFEIDLESFVNDLAEQGRISSSAAANAKSLWKRITAKCSKGLCMPDASAGQEGAFAYIWDKDEHHLELEVMPDGSVEYFYRNRSTGEIWGLDSNYSDEFSPELLVRLGYFC